MKKNNTILSVEFLPKSSESSSERLLFLAVILQAFLDATKPKAKNESDTSIFARERATAWFFAKVGVTCSNFEYICDNANIDPEYVREFAFKVLKSKKVDYVRKRINKILDKNRY
jgi:hypothetical protein